MAPAELIRTLFPTAHPDDAEVKQGHLAMAEETDGYSLVATRGEKGINRLSDPDFVINGGRILESQAGLAHVGLPLERQFYMDGPEDGNLMNSVPVLALKIAGLVIRHDIKRVVSLDPLDKHHPDHVATYDATVLATKLLEAEGYDVEHLALDDAGNGELWFPATVDTIRRKLGAMAQHKTQYPVREIDTAITNEVLFAGYAIDPEFWSSFVFRSLILQGESYNVVRQGKSGGDPAQDYLQQSRRLNLQDVA
jgi:LmbE family N-acetylglucosaminyl deacetylase